MKTNRAMKVFVTALSLMMVMGLTFFADASVTHAAKKKSAKVQRLIIQFYRVRRIIII